MKRHVGHSDSINRANAKSQLASLLAGARSLDGFSIEMLARTHKVSPKEIEVMLTAARERRAAHG